MDKVTVKDDKITIEYGDYGTIGRNYGELFDMLGDYDIITASEIGQNAIVMSGDVYLLDFQDEMKLRKEGLIVLHKESSLEDFVDMDNPDHVSFLKWYKK